MLETLTPVIYAIGAIALLFAFGHGLASRRLPHSRRTIGTCRYDSHRVRTKGSSCDIAIMPQRLAHRLASHCFPHPRRAVATRRHHPFPIGTKVRVPDVFIML